MDRRSSRPKERGEVYAIVVFISSMRSAILLMVLEEGLSLVAVCGLGFRGLFSFIFKYWTRYRRALSIFSVN